MTLDERLEALAQSLELLQGMHMDNEKRIAAADERIAATNERIATTDERIAAAEERHDREMEDIRREARAMRTDLRRAFALGVQEARNERRRSAALDEKITQLAAAQLITEEKLQSFIDALRRGGNGNPAAHLNSPAPPPELFLSAVAKKR
jgi:chromosome segregation ATPase